MATRVFVYSPDLYTFYGELVCRTVRSWVLNTPDESLATATAYVAITDPILSTDLLRFRNILYIHDGVLPDYVGQIGEPQDYSQSEIAIGSTAIEILLDDYHPLDTIIGLPGQIFRQTIADANAGGAGGLIVGDVDDGDSVMGVQQGSKTALDVVKTLQLRTGFEWGVDGNLPKGQPPELTAWFRQFTGYDYTGETPYLPLDETLNIRCDPSGVILSKTGRVKNASRIVASSGSNVNAFVGTHEDAVGQSIYGRAVFTSGESAKNQTQTDRRAVQAVAERSEPLERFQITVNDPAMFPYLRIGSYFPLELRTTGFQDGRVGGFWYVRIIAMSYDDMVNEVELTVESVS